MKSHKPLFYRIIFPNKNVSLEVIISDNFQSKKIFKLKSKKPGRPGSEKIFKPNFLSQKKINFLGRHSTPLQLAPDPVPTTSNLHKL